MSVTCIFSKRVTLIPGKKTWSVKQWAEALLERLWLADWGLPKIILSDQDKKFLSDFWSTLFKRLGVQLLYATAYHPQTDGQSERTNQTVESTLWYFLATLKNPAEWPQCLLQIQSVLNNSKTLTGRTSNVNEFEDSFKGAGGDSAATLLPQVSRNTSGIKDSFA